MSEVVQLAMAVLMFFATAFAAYATWRAPRSAAELAEQLRQASEKEIERRRHKLQVFAMLMQDRNSFATRDGVRSLNLIDVIYHDCPAVREAWSELFLTFDAARGIPSHVQDERLRKLLLAMAVDLGLGNTIRTDDIGRAYYPNALAEEELVQRLERQAALARLQNKAPTATADTAAPSPSPPNWPPRPT